MTTPSRHPTRPAPLRRVARSGTLAGLSSLIRRRIGAAAPAHKRGAPGAGRADWLGVVRGLLAGAAGTLVAPSSFHGARFADSEQF